MYAILYISGNHLSTVVAQMTEPPIDTDADDNAARLRAFPGRRVASADSCSFSTSRAAFTASALCPCRSRWWFPFSVSRLAPLAPARIISPMGPTIFRAGGRPAVDAEAAR